MGVAILGDTGICHQFTTGVCGKKKFEWKCLYNSFAKKMTCMTAATGMAPIIATLELGRAYPTTPANSDC